MRENIISKFNLKTIENGHHKIKYRGVKILKWIKYEKNCTN